MQDIFHSLRDPQRFLKLLAIQKAKLPFFLYAYCLMTNHVHLLIERMTDDLGRILHRDLTGEDKPGPGKSGQACDCDDSRCGQPP